MRSELEIRACRPADEGAILALFRQSYGRDMGQDYWSWRFQHNPSGPGIIYLAWDGDTLAAHYAVTPVRFQVGGRELMTALSGTTMTHPDYRGRRLFPILAQTTYDFMAESGMALVWGFPNLFSHRGLIRDLDWVDVQEVPTLRLPLVPGFELAGGSTGVVELSGFDARFDDLWHRVRDGYPVIARRDGEQLQWRYVHNPGAGYTILALPDGDQVLGYAVLKRFYTEMQVVDILVARDGRGAETGVRLIARAIEIAQENSALSIALWLNVTHPLHHALEKLGFRHGEPITYFCGRVLTPDPAAPDLYDFRCWHLTMGDSDVF